MLKAARDALCSLYKVIADVLQIVVCPWLGDTLFRPVNCALLVLLVARPLCCQSDRC